MPPLFFINVFNGIRFLTRATYRSALDHLLMVLLSSLCSHVQRITAANGSAFVSTVTPANLYPRRMSFLVRWNVTRNAREYRLSQTGTRRTPPCRRKNIRPASVWD